MIARRHPASLAAASPLALLVGAAVVVAPSIAPAQCVPNAAGFRCTGVDPDGVDDLRTGVVGLITPGASVRGSPSIEVGEDATLVIAETGALDPTFAIGIAAGDGLTVLNDGDIGGLFGVSGGGTAVETGDDATITIGSTGTLVSDGGIVFAGDGLTFTNAGDVGVLAANGRGILADDDATVINSGAFFSQENFVLADDDLRVVNTGVMEGVAEGVVAGDRLRLTNGGALRANVTVEADADAIVSNAGSIEGDTFAILLGRNGVVANEPGGVVRLGSAGTDVAIAATGDLEVENQGLIEAAAGDAVAAEGAARVVNDFSATIRGERTALDVGPGSFIDNMGVIEGGTDATVRARTGPDPDDEASTVTVSIGEGTILNRAPGGDGVVAEGPGLLNISTSGFGAFEVEGVAVLSEGPVSASVFGVPVFGGEAGIVGGDGSSIFTFEDGASVTAGGDAIRFGRDAVVGIDSGVGSSDGDAVSIVDGEVTVFEDSGGLFSGAGAGLRIRAPGGGEAPAGPTTVDLFGDGSSIAGAVGVVVEPGNTARQTISVANLGSIGGASGVAIDLGAGDDAVSLFSGGEIDGDVLLGAGADEASLFSGALLDGDVLFGRGNDRLIYERSMFEEVADVFGLFDGGRGFDVASFDGFGLGDLDATPVAGGFELLFEDGASRLAATLTGFERVRLDDAMLTLPRSQSPAPVPLPAGLPLFVGALGGLVALRRWRGRVQRCLVSPLPQPPDEAPRCAGA